MHPDLLRALANARHEDLLEGHQSRLIRLRPDDHPRRFARPRHRIGQLLISAGARLLRDQRAVLELVHESSG